jgi:hypothetical protein
MIIYFWVGAIGFYVLVYKIFKNNHIAFAAYSIFLFSGYGMHFFVFQLLDVLIFVPVIWFFYFILSFFESPEKKYLFGITLILMLAATTYIPFGFILNAGIGLLCLSAFYWKEIVPTAQRVFTFFLRHKCVTFFCLFYIIFSTMPLLMWRAVSADPQYVIDIDRRPESSRDVAETSQKAVDKVSIPAMVTLSDLFDNLDSSSQIMPFVSIFIYGAFWLTLFTQMNRRSYVVFCSFFLLFVISCGSIFPVHPWLFQHLKIFRIFRNYIFFFPELIALAIIFLMGRLQYFNQSRPISRKGKCLFSVWGILSFVGMIIFLKQFDYIIITSYLTVALTIIGFFIWVWKDNIDKKVFFIAITLIALVQPLEFFHIMRTRVNREVLPQPVLTTQFSFSRPEKGTSHNEGHSFLYRYKILKDESGFTNEGFYGLKYVQDLHRNVPAQFLKDYIQNKFYFYENWQVVSSEAEPWEDLKRTFADEKAPALIFGDSVPAPQENKPSKRIAVRENTDLLYVNDFNVNGILMTVNLPTQRWLVYNDTFHTNWRCYIDGKPAPIFRTNYAFKGIKIDAGRHMVKFIFGNPAAYIFPWALLGAIAVFWIITISSFLKGTYADQI